MAAPGWYPDPHDPRSNRYWDGFQWLPQPPAQRGRTASTWVLIVTGAITAVIAAIVIFALIVTHGFSGEDYDAGYNGVVSDPAAARNLDASGGLNRFGICMRYYGWANQSRTQGEYAWDDFADGCYKGLDEILGPGPHGIG